MKEPTEQHESELGKPLLVRDLELLEHRINS
jgi:hypothetical protein